MSTINTEILETNQDAPSGAIFLSYLYTPSLKSPVIRGLFNVFAQNSLLPAGGYNGLVTAAINAEGNDIDCSTHPFITKDLRKPLSRIVDQIIQEIDVEQDTLITVGVHGYSVDDARNQRRLARVCLNESKFMLEPESPDRNDPLPEKALVYWGTLAYDLGITYYPLLLEHMVRAHRGTEYRFDS